MGSLLYKVKALTNDEKQVQKDCKSEIDNKNLQILNYVIVGCVTIFAGRTLEAIFYYSKIYGNHALTIITTIMLIYAVMVMLSLKHKNSAINVTAMIYIVDFILVVYAVVVSAFTTVGEVNITFVVVLFMIHTLWIDMSWRINLAAIISCIGYLFIIQWFKPPTIYEVEVVNTLTVAALSAVLGYMLRVSRTESFVTKRILQKQVYVDSLTGVSNRRRLFEDIANLKDFNRGTKAVAFALLDIDYFKKYNDSYGHQVGDSCLKQLGDCFLGMQNSNIHFYRYGGEEFVALFNNCDKNYVENNVLRLTNRIQEMNIDHKASPFSKVTLSIGVSFVSSIQDEDHEAYLTKADIALYKAKETGRNKVTYYSDEFEIKEQLVESKVRQR